MAYIVLALGAFLSIGGALSIFHGAGIVEVERGWTGVIAGATALTGGVITIALGLIIKTLQDMRARLERQLATMPLAAASAAFAPQHDFTTPAAEHHALEAFGEPPSLMTPELESGMLAAILATPDVPLEPAAPVHDPAPAVHEDRQHEDPLAAVEPVQPEKSRFKINFKRDPAPLPEPEPAPVAVEEPAPAMDDWLDRAFSALDHETPTGALQDRHVADEPPAPVEHEMAHADHAPVAESAAAEPVPEPLPAEPHHEPAPAPLDAPTSAVIGRYEADGTSYVMYADGSIEAQSDAGVYRFNSMTELKAFIESNG